MIFIGIGAIGVVLVIALVAFFAKRGRGQLLDASPLEDVPSYDELERPEDEL